MRTGALETISGFVTAPSTTLTTVTNNNGNSNTVRYTPGQPYLLDFWGNWQTAGILSIRSPRMHDQVNGIYVRGIASQTYPLGGVFPQKLVSQDALDIRLSGSGTGGDIEQFVGQIYYDNLPGANGIFLRKRELFAYGLFEMDAENSITGLTSGQWGTQRAINAVQDTFKANTYYAITGILTNTRCASVRVSSPDFGNLGVGVPGEPNNKDVNRSYFTMLSDRTGLPLIPVFNSANKGNTFVDVACDENGGTFVVSVQCVQLAPNFDPNKLGA